MHARNIARCTLHCAHITVDPDCLLCTAGTVRRMHGGGEGTEPKESPSVMSPRPAAGKECDLLLVCSTGTM